MALHELKLLFVHVVANASKVHADPASVLIVTAQQLREGCRPLFGKIDAVFRALPIAGFHHVVRLEGFDEPIDHFLRRDRLLIFLLVSVWNLFEERDDAVENPSPQ
jgi:hypothetical protein